MFVASACLFLVLPPCTRPPAHAKALEETPVAVGLLKETLIGKAVSPFRKSKDPKVARMAADLVQRWKEGAAAAAAVTAAAAAATSTPRAESDGAGGAVAERRPTEEKQRAVEEGFRCRTWESLSQVLESAADLPSVCCLCRGGGGKAGLDHDQIRSRSKDKITCQDCCDMNISYGLIVVVDAIGCSCSWACSCSLLPSFPDVGVFICCVRGTTFGSTNRSMNRSIDRGCGGLHRHPLTHPRRLHKPAVSGHTTT